MTCETNYMQQIVVY